MPKWESAYQIQLQVVRMCYTRVLLPSQKPNRGFPVGEKVSDTDNRLLCATLLGQLNNVQTWFSGPQSICENRYLKSKEVWREDPSPGRTVHQGQNAVHTRESVEGSKQVNPVPVITRVLTHRLHLQQVISLHRMSACISWRNTETWCGPLLPFFNET